MHKIWLITDGKQGDEQQCIGVACALGADYKSIYIKPRAPFTWFMPYGSIDPRDHSKYTNSPIAPPFPDIAIASGRRAVAYLRHIKAASHGKCFTVFLKDPRIGSKAADFIWVPSHDKLRGTNVYTTLTSPHNIQLISHQQVISHQQALQDQRIASLSSPRIAVLLGGKSSAYQFTDTDRVNLSQKLAAIAQSGAALMVTASRRTPHALSAAIRTITQSTNGFFWDGAGDNPLTSMLTLADHIIVTADSVNMVGEAVSTGKPVHVFYPTGGSRKTHFFLNGLMQLNAIKPLTTPLESWSYSPINSTPLIAAEIKKRYEEFSDKIRK
jgi:uncharacterized protein